MQKLSFYLVPNRITVVTDMVSDGYVTENRQVYQRNLKLYKGIDNTIELDIRGSDQRKQSVVGKTAVIKFYDAARTNLFTVLATPITGKTGLMSVTVPKTVLANIDPQQLTLAAYIRNANATETILYSDSQFGVAATVELYDGYNDASDLIDTAKTWIYDMGTKDMVSEIVDFGRKINDDYSTAPTNSALFEIHFNPENTQRYNGQVIVEATDDKSLAIGNRWTKIGEIGPSEYIGKRFTGDWRFVRFRFPRWVNVITQTQTTGLVDKVIVRN